MYEYQCTDVFLRELFLIKKVGPVGGGRGGGGMGESTGKVRVGLAGDSEIWTQFAICLGADCFL